MIGAAIVFGFGVLAAPLSGVAGAPLLEDSSREGAVVAELLTGPSERAVDRSRRLRVALRVGTTKFDGVGVSRSLPARIEGLGLEILRAEGVVTTVNGEYTAEVVVAPLGHGGDGYVSTIVVLHGDQEVPGSRHRVKCELCLEDELLSQLRGEFVDVVATIKDDHLPPLVVEPESLAGPSLSDELVESPVCVPLSRPELPPKRWIGPLGSAGLGAVVVGAVTMASGMALLVAGDKHGRDVRRASSALLAGGGVAMAAGLGLFAVDRRLRDSRQSVAPTVSTAGAGLVWSGRF